MAPIRWILNGRFSVMLIMFATLFLIVPLGPREVNNRISFFDIVIMLVFISCLRAVVVSKRYLCFLIALTVINIGIGSTAILSSNSPIGFIAIVQLFKIVYTFLIFYSIMRYILHSSPVTSDKIYGAICAYFLMGFMWADGFMLLHQIDPVSFKVPMEMLSDKQWPIYFSFTTLTTLGYGDISPQTTAARAYAVLEAAAGQIFLAVIIARLVALQIIHGNGRIEETDQS